MASTPQTRDVENGVNGSPGHEGEEERELDLFVQKYQTQYQRPKEYSALRTAIMAFQTLGVVYGDLATSPLYVLPSVKFDNMDTDDLLGIFCLVFWTLTLISLIKYVFIVLRADDNGEGVTFALYSFLNRHINFNSKFSIKNKRLPGDVEMKYYGKESVIKSKTKRFIKRHPALQNSITFVVLLGTCMVIGDGALTPATSVLSALSGIQSLSDKVTQKYVVIMSLVLLLLLFLFQRFGTSKVGFSFSPIMLMWLVSNALIGIYNIIKYYPPVLKAISPTFMVMFFSKHGPKGRTILGSVVLCITGAEAMFADLGHFNKTSIQLAFSTFVYPVLVFTYGGQIAYLIKHPDQISTAFYSAIPKAVYWPMFVVATLAATVASQSMVSASYSVVKQSLALGCFPRVNVKHTSSKHEGQVYLPEINYILMIICISLVVGFRDGVQIGNAYGVVVIWVMIITTVLVTLVMLVIWDLNIFLTIAFFVPFVLIEGAFVISLLEKIPQGGWVPFAISAFFMVIMLSWTMGRSTKNAYDLERMMKTDELNQMLSSSSGVHRSPGICFFCTDLVNGIPPIVRHYIQHTNSVREIMIIVTVRTLPIKTVLPEERLDVGKLGGIEGMYRCLVQYGYKDPTNLEGDDFVASVVGKLLEIAESPKEVQRLEAAKAHGVVFVTGRTILKSKESSGWFNHLVIEGLYRFFQKNSRSAVSSLKLPPRKTMQVGMLYEI